MKPSQTLYVSVLFLLILLAASVWFYPDLPARVPVHWNAEGQVNGYMPPLKAVAMPIGILVLLSVLTVLLPRISPRSYEIAPFATAFGIVMLAAQALILIVGLCILLNAVGHPVNMPRISLCALGLLLIVQGNYMGKLRKNFFAGIKTPWTLASDAVWERTHRLAGWLFVLAGCVIVVAVLAGMPPWVSLATVLAAALIPAVYSYFIYRRLEGRHPSSGGDVP